jgi:hypothetical protein
MTELVAIRTLLKLKALENIPVDGSISLQALAKATGAQESLLGLLLMLYQLFQPLLICTDRMLRLVGESDT